jgi:general secretion pathway protein G
MWERMKEKRNEGGFTLIELLIVVVILAILAAIVVFAVGTTSTNAVTASCKADVKSAETAVEAYKAEAGAYPADLSNLTTSTVISSQTIGPWLRETPSNPSYTIVYTPANGSVSATGATNCP